ncbi:peptide deformylase [Larkinella harenae]
MIYPIVAYGDPILRKRAEDIKKEELDVKQLSADMLETLFAIPGAGLAAPQIGQAVRLFVVDARALLDEDDDEEVVTEPTGKVFINPELLETDEDEGLFEEGCLSMPGFTARIFRPVCVKIRYFDTDWNEHIDEYQDRAASVIQHEYDHLEGKLFTDYLPPLKRQLLKKKLADIVKGHVSVTYKMTFVKS